MPGTREPSLPMLSVDPLHRNQSAAWPRRPLARRQGLCVTSVAACHLAPSTIKDDVSHELQITNKRIWCGRRVLDHRSGSVECVKQLIDIDSFDEDQPVVCAEILDGKFHEIQHRVLVCMGQLKPSAPLAGERAKAAIDAAARDLRGIKG